MAERGLLLSPKAAAQLNALIKQSEAEPSATDDDTPSGSSRPRFQDFYAVITGEPSAKRYSWKEQVFNMDTFAWQDRSPSRIGTGSAMAITQAAGIPNGTRVRMRYFCHATIAGSSSGKQAIYIFQVGELLPAGGVEFDVLIKLGSPAVPVWDVLRVSPKSLT